MKLKTLCKLLEDYDLDETVKVDRDGYLLIGGPGGFLIKLPTTYRRIKPA